jgi:hypothetical protein
MLRRCLRLLGALSLAVWAAMLALAILAWAAIPVWPPHARPRGAPLPPRLGACVFDAVVGIATVDCRDIPAASLIGDVLTYAAYWVLLVPTLPIWAPHLWGGLHLVWHIVLPSALSLGFAVWFVRDLLARRKARRAGR